MSLVIYGDPHGDWRPLLEAVALDRPAAIVILGDCDLGRPLHVELAPVFAAGVEVAYLYGNHEKDLPGFWDNLVGDHPGGLLHARVRRLGPYDVAGVAGVFKQRIWLPPPRRCSRPGRRSSGGSRTTNAGGAGCPCGRGTRSSPRISEHWWASAPTSW